MILSWTSSEPVVSRIMRNIKGIPAEYMDDILEWIPEAVSKMQTKYTLEYKDYDIQIEHHQGLLPCKIEGLMCVLYNGCQLSYYGEGIRRYHPSSAAGKLFNSVVPIYTSSGDLSDGDTGRSKFPRDVIVAMDTDFDESNWYRVNVKILQTSIECGCVKAWVQQIPKDESGYPLIPGNEHFLEAIYRYCRMMLIETGFEDKVMNIQMATHKWEDAKDRAIAAVCFPTPDQVKSSNERHLQNFFPDDFSYNPQF